MKLATALYTAAALLLAPGVGLAGNEKPELPPIILQTKRLSRSH